MKKMSNLKKLACSAIVMSALAAYPCYKLHKMWPYLRDDYTSEATRLPSQGHPKSRRASLEELTKNARDYWLYLRNDTTDNLPNYDIYVDKTTNKMEIYLDNKLIKAMDVGTGQLYQTDKTQFGEFVTPNGDYLLIEKLDSAELRKKFGSRGERDYANGMLQLSGKWAPYIAIHATNDESRLGKRKSNGCVNVTRENMDWMLQNIGIGSKVHIYQSDHSGHLDQSGYLDHSGHLDHSGQSHLSDQPAEKLP